MQTGLLVALAFGLAILALAVVLPLLMRKCKHDPNDLNAASDDGRATATWEGIRQARDIDHGDNN